ncbi:ABC transporter permease [Acidithiobacillus ferriphilus]|jgi:lipopolysaccharide transport system permease protein|uniref:ABC transporter permease n=1 Tax=Acidithiobacillus ferriphilus TaxID=1689834 RepID=UPI00242AACDF|nr:ABC transporter permease [Acidithiobacillus ferriphilus]MBW9248356.1 ABC transporter permease [Acidithiobacillus ferriphilus]MBW9253715.1 ABC transporter permease [Acidithiobacillus ferriphilus]MEB8535205.1 ABC transporter permease [Acidithiobacillus ferriphilus]
MQTNTIAPSSGTATGFARYWQYRDLVRNLVAKDLKVRYQGAALGFLWSLGNPLALILLYDFVFTHIFRSDLPNYILYLIIGVLHYNLFSQSVSQSCESLTGASGLIQKIYFPRILVPTASLLFTLALWLIAILILVVLYPFLGGVYHWGLLLYPLALGLYIAFIWGIVLTFSVLQVELRDLKHLVEIALMFGFWLTPIGYDIHVLKPTTREIIALNPLTQFMDLFHALLYAGTLPALSHVLIATAWTGVTLTVGTILFRRKARHLVEDL